MGDLLSKIRSPIPFLPPADQNRSPVSRSLGFPSNGRPALRELYFHSYHPLTRAGLQFAVHWGFSQVSNGRSALRELHFVLHRPPTRAGLQFAVHWGFPRVSIGRYTLRELVFHSYYPLTKAGRQFAVPWGYPRMGDVLSESSTSFCTTYQPEQVTSAVHWGFPRVLDWETCSQRARLPFLRPTYQISSPFTVVCGARLPFLLPTDLSSSPVCRSLGFPSNGRPALRDFHSYHPLTRAGLQFAVHCGFSRVLDWETCSQRARLPFVPPTDQSRSPVCRSLGFPSNGGPALRDFHSYHPLTRAGLQSAVHWGFPRVLEWETCSKRARLPFVLPTDQSRSPVCRSLGFPSNGRPALRDFHSYHPLTRAGIQFAVHWGFPRVSIGRPALRELHFVLHHLPT
ncbi:hypothetical protein GE061_013990 [Apolygus lucorum]|uniref:Uncharacterized protein n=1 Tax=Apolygus lucorum TaxID=248454 RepID=A0A8S9XQK9_APOLU|nr:hypothetical protein GE061_013990 [Apolygus lucorum]